MRTSASTALLVLASLFVAGCSAVHWVSITNVEATDRSSTSLGITIDACSQVPAPRVVESDTEVHLLVDLKFDYGADQKLCAGGALVRLAQPIGTRQVIDDRTGVVIPVTWALP